MTAMQSSGYWFTLWPFLVGLGLGLFVGYQSMRLILVRRRRTW